MLCRYLVPLLLTAVAGACAGEDVAQRLPITIPRYRGFAPEAVFNQPEEGYPYNPRHVALAWSEDDRIYLLNSEEYGAYDYRHVMCGGTALYAFPSRGGALQTVVPSGACRLLWAVPIGLSDQFDAAHLRLLVNDYRQRDPRRRAGIFVIRAGTVIPLPRYRDCYSEHVLSPDGGRLALVSFCEESGIYLMNLDGTDLHRVVPGDSRHFMHLAWSPDESRFAFAVGPAAPAERWSYVGVADTSGGYQILTYGLVPAWSPDGQWLAFLAITFGPGQVTVEDFTLNVIRGDGTGERVLFRNDVPTTYGTGFGEQREGWPSGNAPVWSPDGRTVLFSRKFALDVTVWSVDVVTGEIRQVTAADRGTD